MGLKPSSCRFSFAKAFLLLMAILSMRAALANNCAWQNGDGRFQDKSHWLNCFPGTDDNVIIGSPLAIDSTAVVTINRPKEEFHNLYVGAGGGVDLYTSLYLHGNEFVNSGTLNLISTNVIPNFRSYSKNLVVYGLGTVNLFGGDISGNVTFGSGQTIRGRGTIGANSNLLVVNGTVQADVAGREILFQRAVDGTGTFRSLNGGRLSFTADASGDYLVNNGLVQINGGNFYVGKDYQGAYFDSGNNFDARRTVQGAGGIYAADARQIVTGPRLSGNVIDFGAMRVGDQVATSLTLTNGGALTTLRGAVKNIAAPNVQLKGADFVLAPGGAGQTTGLTFTGRTAGSVTGQTIDVVNNFDNVADGHYAVRAQVYAPAVLSLPSTTVDFGTVRKGTAGVSGGLTIGNLATGGLTDRLVPTFGHTPSGISLASSPTAVLAGTAATVTYALDTRSAGAFGGSSTIGFTSHDQALADLSLGSKTIAFEGTVTDPAVAELARAGGAGLFAGSGNSYTLDLGTLSGSFSTVSTEISVLNAVSGWLYAETLGGGFAFTGDSGFSFSGESFSGLAASDRDVGNWLRFDPNGLSEGAYRATLTFNGFSHYVGLADQRLDPIELTVSAVVTSVPEPTSWLLMGAGFCVIGMAFRTRARTQRPSPERGGTPRIGPLGGLRCGLLAVSAAIVPLAGCMTAPKPLVGVHAVFPDEAMAKAGADVPAESTKGAIYEVAFSDVFRLANLSASQAQLNVEDVQQQSGLIYATRSTMVPGNQGSTIPSRFYYVIHVEELAAKRTRVRIAAKFQAQCEKLTTGARVIFAATSFGITEAMIAGLEKKGETCDDVSSPTWAKLSYSAEPEMAQFLTFLRNNLLAARLI